MTLSPHSFASTDASINATLIEWTEPRERNHTLSHCYVVQLSAYSQRIITASRESFCLVLKSNRPTVTNQKDWVDSWYGKIRFSVVRDCSGSMIVESCGLKCRCPLCFRSNNRLLPSGLAFSGSLLQTTVGEGFFSSYHNTPLCCLFHPRQIFRCSLTVW